MIESLESRIAPAAVVHFFEADGDKVTVKTSKGTSADLLLTLTDQNGVAITEGETGITSFNVNFLKTAATIAAFANTDLTISAAKTKGLGNKTVNFVSVNAFDANNTSIDLKNVTIKGNLVFIDAGDADITTNAITKLDVTNMGPGDGNPNATVSEIHGHIKTVKIKDDFNGYIKSEDAAGNANFQTGQGTVISSFTVGDDISSIDGDNVGHLQVRNIAKLVVKDTFFGPAGAVTDCGLIEADSLDLISIHRMSVNAQIILS